MSTNPACINSSLEDSVSSEDSDRLMDQDKFLERWKYSLLTNFTSSSGIPATWASGYPKSTGVKRKQNLPLMEMQQRLH